MANTNNNTTSNNDEVNSSEAKLTEYKVNGQPINLFANYVDFAEDSDYYKGLKYFALEDPWNLTKEIPEYKIKNENLKLTKPGTAPTFFMPGVTDSKMLSVGGATITIKRTNNGIEYNDKELEGNEGTTLLCSRKTEYDTIPERMMIWLQGAGGSGANGNWNTSSAGGGSGAWWCGIIDLTAGTWVITLGKGGKHGGGESNGNRGTDSFLDLDSHTILQVGGGYGGKYGSGAGGAGGTIKRPANKHTGITSTTSYSEKGSKLPEELKYRKSTNSNVYKTVAWTLGWGSGATGGKVGKAGGNLVTADVCSTKKEKYWDRTIEFSSEEGADPVTLHYFKVSQATITGGKADNGGGGGASSLVSGGNGGGDGNPDPEVVISEAIKAHSYNEALSTYLKDLENEELQKALFNLGHASIALGIAAGTLGTAIATAVSTSIISAMSLTAATGAATGPVGWIIGAITCAVLGIALAIISFVDFDRNGITAAFGAGGGGAGWGWGDNPRGGNGGDACCICWCGT